MEKVEIIWFQEPWFQALLLMYIITSVLSLFYNYRFITSKKDSANKGEIYSLWFWLLCGWVFPIVSCFALIILDNKMK